MAPSVRRFKESDDLRSGFFKRLRAHRFFPIGVVTILVIAVACGHIWQRVVVLDLLKDVTRLEAEQRSLIDDTRKLRSEIDQLSMAARIETLAMDSLGLQHVHTDRLLTLVPPPQKKPATVVEQRDEFTTMISSIKRVAKYLPTISETQAEAATQITPEMRQLKFDSTAVEEWPK